ncbi:hypothetical protein CDIK_0852 [Cucumispora dikerogammari]|nr:hypothetical protein CDIK_0852 [Cucumispora dikerogammari]
MFNVQDSLSVNFILISVVSDIFEEISVLSTIPKPSSINNNTLFVFGSVDVIFSRLCLCSVESGGSGFIGLIYVRFISNKKSLIFINRVLSFPQIIIKSKSCISRYLLVLNLMFNIKPVLALLTT